MANRMLKCTGIALVLAFSTVLAAAQSAHPAEGTYNVAASSSELGTINFLLTLKRAGDKWTGEIKDSPMPLTVTTVTVDADNKVVIVTDAGGQNVTIQGKLANGKITGDWTAGDMKGTWTAAKKDAMATDKAVAAAPAAAASSGAAAPAPAAGASLEGTYEAKVIADGQGELPFTLIIKKQGDKLVTEVQNGGDLNVTGIEVKDGEVVNLTATYQGNGPIPLNGKRTGAEMGGKWEFGGFSGTWSAKKK